MPLPPIRLEPFGPEHLDLVAPMLDDPDVARFTRIPVPVPARWPEQWLAMYELGRRTGSREAWVAFDAEDAFVGMGMAPEIDFDTREVELGYVVAPNARGRGVATAILTQLTAWAFDEAQALRVTLLVQTDNVASQRVAARAGYVLEGTLRSVHHKDDARVDAQLWSRLPSDP